MIDKNVVKNLVEEWLQDKEYFLELIFGIKNIEETMKLLITGWIEFQVTILILEI